MSAIRQALLTRSSLRAATSRRAPVTRSITSTAPPFRPAAALAVEDSPFEDMPAPVRTTQQWQEFGRQHVTHGLARLRDHVVVKGKGLELFTTEGERLLDFTSGIGVVNLGHSHPAVCEAAANQVHSIVHMQCSIAFSAPYLQLIERLLPIMPDPSLDSFFFWNSGSEANEAAIKLARQATGRQNIITFQGGYHGRTFGSGSLTRSKPIYTQGTGPLMNGVYTTAFPYWHSMGLVPSTSEEELVRLAKHQLDLVLKQQVHPTDVAAIFVEPVQGEGGYVPIPSEFLIHLRKVCDEHGILLVVDEVQTGFFRTGKYFAIEHVPGFRPDVMVFAKGVANGFPLSGIVAPKYLMDKVTSASLGGTYAGNAVACAAGVAVQDVFQTEDIGKNVEERSAQLYQALNTLAAKPKIQPLIADIRGVGLMAAVEFRSPTDALTHDGLPEGTHIPMNIGKRVQDYCLDRGLLILTTSCFDTIRFIPSLVVSQAEMDEAISIFTAAVEQVAREG